MLKISKFLLAFSGVVIGLSSVPAASAQNNCKHPDSLKGAYGYTVTGFILPGAPLIPGPFVAVGRIVFDGTGGVTTVRSLSDNGVIVQNDVGSGTYSLNQNCTGSFNISVVTPSGTVILTLDIVLDDNNQIRGVVTTPNIALALEGRKQQ